MNSLLLQLTDNAPGSKEDVRHDRDNTHNIIIDEIVMLLSSRPRLGYIDDVPRLNASVLNYGVNEHFGENTSRTERTQILQQRIEIALQRFESRLQNVEVAFHFESLSRITFVINGQYQNQLVEFMLVWDDAMSQFLGGNQPC